MFTIVFFATLIASHVFAGAFKNHWVDDIEDPKSRRHKIEKTLRQDTNVSLKDTNFVTTATSLNETIICGLIVSPSNGTITTPWDHSKPAIQPKGAHCAPRLTVVMLEENSWPPTITLHRCVGGCLSQRGLLNCTVARQHEVRVKVYDLSSVSFMQKVTAVYNHTECVCHCMKRSSRCNKTIQKFNPHTCSCECLKKANCNSEYMKWNDDTCQCSCKTVPLPCSNNTWNEQTCDCNCPEKVIRRCKRKNKVLNRATCQCDCPPSLPCGPNERFFKKNCTCA